MMFLCVYIYVGCIIAAITNFITWMEHISEEKDDRSHYEKGLVVIITWPLVLLKGLFDKH